VRVTRRGGNVRVSLDRTEREIIRMLLIEVMAMLDDSEPGTAADASAPAADDLEQLVGITEEPVEPPADPAVRRLLPDAYADDPAAAGEFRRLMDGDLRAAKVSALQRVVTDLDTGRTLTLTADEVEVWLQALNDVRLVLGVRLDVKEDDDERWARLRPEDPEAALLFAYDQLTWLQQSLVEAVDPG